MAGVEALLAYAELGRLEYLPIDNAQTQQREVKGRARRHKLIGQVISDDAYISVLERAEAEQVRRHAHHCADQPDDHDH